MNISTFFSTVLLCIVHGTLFSQIVMSDTVCIDRPVTISTTVQANSYYWNFCSGNLRDMPQGKQLAPIAEIEKPAFIEYAIADSQIYAFVTNHQKATITRLSYGKSFQNVPKAVDLGSFNNKVPNHTQGIQLVNDAGNWYGFVVGGQKENSKLLRLSFGTSLENTPTTEEYYFPTVLDYPIDLVIASDAGKWYGFTNSYNNSSVVRFSFGNSLTNKPTADALGGATQFTNPCGLNLFQEDGQQYLFVTNYTTNSLSRLSFGNSLQNKPQIKTFDSQGTLQFPFDLSLLRDCEHLFGFVLNRFGGVVRIDFTSPSADPQFVSLGNANYLFNPQGISDVFRRGDTLYAFVANIDNSSISQMMFPACSYASPSWSNIKNPPSVKFSKLGNVNIRLETNSATANRQSYCKNIEVVENPVIDLKSEVLLLPGEKVELDAGDGYASYQWSNKQASQKTSVDTYGMYYVTVTNKYGCSAVDSVEVKYAGIPSVVTPNGDGLNDTWEIRLIELFPSVQISIFDRRGNLVTSYDGSKRVWDCTYNNGQAVRADTYWYVIELGGSNRTQKGQVTVLRE